MRFRRKNFWLLIISLLFFLTLFLIILFLSPEGKRQPFPLIFFFFSLFLFSSSLFSFLLANIRRGIFVGIFIEGFFFLRFLDLKSLLYLVILLAIIILLELTLRE